MKEQIKQAILNWIADGTKTAGTLVREISNIHALDKEKYAEVEQTIIEWSNKKHFNNDLTGPVEPNEKLIENIETIIG